MSFSNHRSFDHHQYKLENILYYMQVLRCTDRKQAEIDASKAPQILTIDHDEAEEVSGNEISTDDDERDFDDSANDTPASSRENSAGMERSVVRFVFVWRCLLIFDVRLSVKILWYTCIGNWLCCFLHAGQVVHVTGFYRRGLEATTTTSSSSATCGGSEQAGHQATAQSATRPYIT